MASQQAAGKQYGMNCEPPVDRKSNMEAGVSFILSSCVLFSFHVDQSSVEYPDPHQRCFLTATVDGLQGCKLLLEQKSPFFRPQEKSKAFLAQRN
jgi:hypothetical protein